MQNFTIYMIAFEKIRAVGFDVAGPRIGMCAPDIELVDSKVDACGRGCPANNGLGIIDAPGICAGAGGSHGGLGGYGGTHSLDNSVQETCKNIRPTPYFFEDQGRYEGSGGMHGNTYDAGAGGGIIWLSATGNTELYDTILSVNGEDAGY